MNHWFYLSFGFGLIFTWLRKEEAGGFGPQGIREIGAEVFRLVAAVGILVPLHTLLTCLIWGPSGRDDLGRVSLLLWAFVIGEGMERPAGKGGGKIRIPVSRSFLALAGFSLWIVEGPGRFPTVERFLWGLGLPVGMGLAEWLLAGLRERVKLSNIPPLVAGAPILFWLAMLLLLAFCGFQEIASHL